MSGKDAMKVVIRRLMKQRFALNPVQTEGVSALATENQKITAFFRHAANLSDMLNEAGKSSFPILLNVSKDPPYKFYTLLYLIIFQMLSKDSSQNVICEPFLILVSYLFNPFMINKTSK